MSTLAGHPYLPRAAWHASPPVALFHPVAVLPTPRLWIHHSGTEQHGPDGVWAIQRDHQTRRGWKDIAYNFLVDDDGTIYEGRGPGIAGGATKGDNTRSHSICLLGNYETRAPTPAAWETLVDLARHGRHVGWWNPTCGGHRDAPGAATACPGRHLAARLMLLRRQVARLDPRPTTEEPPDMIMFQSAETGAVLLLSGGVAFLIQSNAELDNHRRAGIPLVTVAHAQFRIYEKVRVA